MPVNVTRLNEEIDTAARQFAAVERHQAPDGSVYVLAALQTPQSQLYYTLSILVPTTYPNQMPAVYVRKPALRPGTGHVYNDGNICFMHPSMWNPGRHNVTFVLGRAAKWLNKYEVWRATGRWPGAAVRH
ncbi:MAG: hypothetical protein V3U43_06715 [Pseudomonadales bacterium]